MSNGLTITGIIFNLRQELEAKLKDVALSVASSQKILSLTTSH